MSRNFVNGLANFVVEGNLVSFTLTDQRGGGTGKPAGSPQPVSDVVMRLNDFTQMVRFLNDAAKEIEKKTGQKPATPASAPRPAAQPTDNRPPLGAKLSPKKRILNYGPTILVSVEKLPSASKLWTE